jgi:two-component system, OmpR family, response regulator VicR
LIARTAYPAIRSSVMQVVCIEDEPAVIDYIRYVLGKEGINVLGAVGGVQGLEVIQREKPDLVFLDLMMPDVNGWEVYERLKADPVLEKIPVVIITARSRAMDDALGIHFPAADAVLTKPIFGYQLLQTIKKVVGSQPPPAPPAMPKMLPVKPASLHINEISRKFDGRTSLSLIDELRTLPDLTRAGELVVELACRRRREAHLMADTPAQDGYWRNVFHTLASLSLDTAVQKWGQTAPVARALTLPPPDQNAALIDLVSTDDEEVQKIAITALGRNHETLAVDSLLHIAGTVGQEVRITLIEALGRIGDSRALPVVRAALADVSLSVRYVAINALAMLGTDEAAASLHAVLQMDDRGHRLDAIRALIGSESRVTPATAAGLLLPLVDDEADTAVLYTLCVAFGHLGTVAGVRPALDRLAQHPESHVRGGAAKALEMLQT